ncbi:unnamed protein product [Lactuca saligna]|uniref:C3H1-type domain-containing protein n=1 Tax=Lactuca saligna TaxID=75948 RepID=A0AA35ZVG3_LACSI|nr:unnamed protein product [Lactuca saligna]
MSQHHVNQGTNNIFYKTRICHKFLEGNCGNGDSCTFAHGSNDLREPPPNWPELVKHKRGLDLDDDQRIIHQMKICQKFAKTGECSYGEKCIFLHESPAKFKGQITERTSGDSVIKIQTMVECGQPNGSHIIKVTTSSSDPNAKFLKSRICSKWETTKTCPLGDKCHFAHGIKELNTPVAPTEVHGSTATSALRLPVTELPPSNSATAVPLRQGEGRGFAKLRLSNKKINRIYGDWIDYEKDEQDD